MTLKNYL